MRATAAIPATDATQARRRGWPRGAALAAVCVTALAGALVSGPAAAQTPPSAAEAAHYTGLHAAAWQGDAARIAQRVAAGAAPDARDGHGRTPLALARARGYAPMVAILLEAGAR